jgi:RNA polymerase sigma-70 factor (ECF subfamily)
LPYLNNKNKNRLFVELCQDYHEKVLKYLYYTIRDLEDAKDLTQEVFTLVYHRMDEVANHPNKAGFIFQTAKYTAANFKRKASKKALMEYPLEPELMTASSDLYDELQMRYDQEIDEGRYIPTVLAALSEEKQALYRLHYLENKSYREIAQSLGTTEVNLRMKYVRLRREIKHIVQSIAKENFI